MKIGIFGGTFNPIHSGHGLVINYMSRHYGFDELWIMVSRLNPMKKQHAGLKEEDRLRMAEIVAERFLNVKVSDFEMRREPPSYTIDTLRELRKLYPTDDFKIIIGSDNWNIFPCWKENDSIIREFGVIVYPRPGYPVEKPIPANVEFASDCPVMAISSSYIRQVASAGENLNYLVPPDVADYISLHGLYKEREIKNQF